MPFWNEKLETHHPNIDADHCELFRMLESFKAAVEGGAGREQIVELIIILQRYALEHFTREEAYMERIQCPTLKANCAAHRDFEQKLEHWLVILTMAGSPVSVMMDVHREAFDWIENHILRVDCGLRHCSRTPGASKSSASPETA